MRIRATVNVCGKCAAFVLAASVVAVVGCSKKRSTPTGPGAHPESWMDESSPDFHGKKVAEQGHGLCLECHAVVAAAGKDSAKALSCANTSACHAAASGPGTLNCESCHKTAELPAGHPRHLAVLGMGAQTCGYCHAQTVEGSGALVDSTHMDARVEVQLGKGATGAFDTTSTTCANSNCHRGTSPAWTSGALLDCNGCHQKAALPGAHAAHFLVIANDCSICHNATAIDSTAIADQAKHLSLGAGEHAEDVKLAATYGGTFDEDNGACSGTYCHGATSPSPDWNGTTHLDCQSCHPDGSLPAAHAAHLAELKGDCSICHALTVSDPTTIINRSKHANRQVDVFLAASWGGIFDDGTGTCDNTYCHNPLAAGSSPAWVSGQPVDCQSCHANGSLPGAHAKHLTATGGRCDYCHESTATASGTLKTDAPHINKAVDVVMSSQAGGAYNSAAKTCTNTYCHSAQTTTPPWDGTVAVDCQSCHPTASLPAGHAVHLFSTGGRCDVCHDATVDSLAHLKPGAPHLNGTADVVLNSGWGGTFAGGTCSGTYCHGAQPTTPNWTDTAPLGCETCHPTANLQNAHAEHLADFAGDCSICHSATASGATTIGDRTKHADRAVEVQMSATWGGAFSGESLTCQGTYCHNVANGATTPGWKSGATLDCQGCHPYATLPDKHNTQLPGQSPGTTHLTMIGNNCAICHSATATSASAVRPDGPHINKINDVVMLSGFGTYGAQSHSCSGGCHTSPSPPWK